MIEANGDQEIEEFIKTVEDDVLENRYSSSFEGGPGHTIPNDIIVSEEVITNGAGDRFYLDDEMPVSISSVDKPFSAMSVTGGVGMKQVVNRTRPLSSAVLRPNTATVKLSNR